MIRIASPTRRGPLALPALLLGLAMPALAQEAALTRRAARRLRQR